MTEHGESGCKCGEDHDKTLADAMPEMMVLGAADSIAWDVEPAESITRAMNVVAESVASSSLEHVISFAKMKNQAPSEMIREYGETMLIHGIMMGAALRNYYGDKFGTVKIPSDDEIEEAIKNYRRHQGQQGNIRQVNPDDLPPHIREQLEKAGIDISQVGVMAMEFPRDESGRFKKGEVPESASDDEPPMPGLYL